MFGCRAAECKRFRRGGCRLFTEALQWGAMPTVLFTHGFRFYFVSQIGRSRRTSTWSAGAAAKFGWNGHRGAQ